MRRQWWTGGKVVVLGLALLLGRVVGAEGQLYPTLEECAATHQVPCSQLEGGWTPNDDVEVTPGDGNKNLPPDDQENLDRQHMSMRTNESGTLDHPVVAVDMNQVEFPDVQPYLDLEIGRVRVPVRFVAEQMGAAVEWNGDTQEVTITNENLRIVLKVDNPMVRVNDKQLEIDAPPRLLPPGRVMVPLRFISEAFGANVDWIGTEIPHPRATAWGKYQVWIWVDRGYWGMATVHERLHIQSEWFYRGEAQL